MRVAVVGCGYVGLVAAACLAHAGHSVIAVEKDPQKLASLRAGRPPIYEPGLEEILGTVGRSLAFVSELPRAEPLDAVLVAVGTPALPDGGPDLSEVRSVCQRIAATAEQPLTVIMKSTVPPGTGLRLKAEVLSVAGVPIRYVANPEFLRQGRAVEDWFRPDRIVIGSDDPAAAGIALDLYADIDAPKLVMDVTSAEMVKYAANAFLATKISFINEIANLCEAVGADIDLVARAVGMDKRIGPSFLGAGLGYGGSCFPKDTQALCYLSTLNGYNFRLLKSVIEVNSQQRFLAIEKLRRLLGFLDGRRIAVLGLAFKPGTDDVRDAPAIEVVCRLVEAGAFVRVHDPIALRNAQDVLPDNVVLLGDPYKCVEGAQGLLLATEWEEYRRLDWSRVKQLMAHPFAVVDGRNALDAVALTDLGFLYDGFGRVTRAAGQQRTAQDCRV